MLARRLRMSGQITIAVSVMPSGSRMFFARYSLSFMPLSMALAGTVSEVVGLTRAMVGVGDRMRWDAEVVARVDRLGPRSVETIRRWLGDLAPGTSIKPTPVVDLTDQISVDSYEIPHRLAEHVRLATPYEVFPYGTRPSRIGDLDHKVARRRRMARQLAVPPDLVGVHVVPSRRGDWQTGPARSRR